jgi:hypothetical protein
VKIKYIIKFIKIKKPPIAGVVFLCNFLILSGLSYKLISLENLLKKIIKKIFNKNKNININFFYCSNKNLIKKLN